MTNAAWADETTVRPEVVATTWTRPGVIVLTSSLQLSYISHEAALLSTRINEVRLGCKAKGVLPQEVLVLCEEILLLLKAQSDGKGPLACERYQVVDFPEYPILLRVLGLPDPSGFSQGRVLILMEEASRSEAPSLREAVRRYRLTEREQRVLEQLFQGLTNKEIANHLDISEQTVKEYIKRLMRKMNVTTRTGILNRMFHASGDPVSPSGGLLAHDEIAQAPARIDC